jgi:hypothetical protein
MGSAGTRDEFLLGNLCLQGLLLALVLLAYGGLPNNGSALVAFQFDTSSDTSNCLVVEIEYRCDLAIAGFAKSAYSLDVAGDHNPNTLHLEIANNRLLCSNWSALNSRSLIMIF